MKHYSMGIDGGGSKTQIVVIDNHNQVVYEKIAGPSAIDTVGIEGCMDTIRIALEEWAIPGMIQSVFAGIGGVANPQHEETLAKKIREISMIDNQALINVKNDVTVALLSKDGTLEGMTLILGTGSVAYGVHQGMEARVGGYHFQEGDLGSGYDLGSKAMRLLAQTLDGRQVSSDFTQALQSETHVTDFASAAAYFNRWNRSEVAKLSKIVTEYASTCLDAYGILDEASNEVKKIVNTLYRRLGFTDTELVLVGGLALAETPYKLLIESKIRSISTSIRIVKPLYTPAHAAAVYAANLLKLNN